VLVVVVVVVVVMVVLVVVVVVVLVIMVVVVVVNVRTEYRQSFESVILKVIQNCVTETLSRFTPFFQHL
jgi:hypothetical protein